MIHSPLLPHLAGYINDRWISADAGKRQDVVNPATGEKLADVPVMGAAETRRAIASAKRALATPADAATRRRWLTAIRDALLEQQQEIGRILCLEHGKPWKEAQGEVQYAASFFDYYAPLAETATAPETLPGKVKDCIWTLYKRPVGVVGLITPWNFPIAMIAKKIAPALAAGCPSLIKPAPDTPLTMIALFQIMADRLDLPKGMVNLVMGDAAQIGGELMHSPDVAMVSFTGSTAVGRLLMQQASPRVKRLGLELGGNAPFIVLDDADLDAAADGLMINKFRGAGQTCVCANRVYVQRGVYDAFAQKLVERVSKLKVGDGMKDGTDIGPLINANGYAKVKGHLADALDKGATLLTGKQPDALNAGDGLFFTPAVIGNVDDTMQCCQEETFGPLIPLISFTDDDEVIRRANDTEFGLAAYVFGKDRARSHRIIAQLHFGHCAYNTGTGPAAIAPFGGMLSSGLGREGGREGLMEYIEVQTVPDGSH
ncbi:NAD-dependent succinate-semialdehyde dehydrogenase [uncultured Castellaniella sp.]|uniref:NAD-dependent succinate-semialdehyde dehydrogenase n=1 Tax=uncultured Castellaniella sp. TaxID=647907 RepID=UPI0026076F71|nr:NAD-dependent succinate-semialdehyde dehydrogenase [uncultured Castellaniella sp.]